MKYLPYLHDIMKLGGAADWQANEQILNFFDLIDDIEGLKIAADTLTESDNVRYTLNYLLQHGEMDLVKEKLETITDFQILGQLIPSISRRGGDVWEKKDGETSSWIIDFIERNNLYDLIKDSIPSKDWNSYMASDLISNICNSLGRKTYFGEDDRPPEQIALFDKFKELYEYYGKNKK